VRAPGASTRTSWSRHTPIAAFREAERRLPHFPDVAALLAYALAVSGDRRKAAVTLRELETRARGEYVPRFVLAVVKMGLGQDAGALRDLKKSWDERPWMMGMLKTLPLLDPLRGHPEFEQLLRRMNLTSDSSSGVT
jgi:hypothetical protein